MVDCIAEAPQAPIVEGGAKTDQQAGDFFAVLAGATSGDSGATGQVGHQTAVPAQSVENADAEAPQDADAQAVPVMMVGLPLMEVQAQVQPQLDQTSAEAEAEAEGANPTQAQTTVSDRTVQQAIPETDASEQVAAVGETTPEAQAEPPPAPATDKQATIEALQEMTVQVEPQPLPEAAKPESEIAARIVAARLNPMGRTARSGEVLPITDDASSGGSAKPTNNAAASAVAGNSRADRQEPADTGTRIQVEWQPAETVTISASSDGGPEDNLQFANHGVSQPEANDVPAANRGQQAFGVEMKAQFASEQVRQVQQTASAHAPQADPTLAEKMVSQIVKGVTLSRLGDNTTLSIRLDPPELGTLRVSVTSQSGVLTTQLESSNAVVRGILETHLPALKEALSSAGVEISEFSVSSGTDFGAQAQRQQQTWQSPRFAPAVAFAGQTQEMPPELLAAASGSRALTAGYSWLA